jgi:pimeloyl-ACP methyl ester carboxylesterase
MSTLAFTRLGSGPPLLLLHALGSSRRVWDPVIPALSEHFDVVAVDLPGFGDSAPLPRDVEPTPEVLAAAVAGLVDDLGIDTAHVVGNSLGGWVALELATLRPAASLTLLSPAGLWRGCTPLYCRISLRATGWLSRHAAGALSRLVNHRIGRILVLGQTHGRPARMTPDQARATMSAAASASGFEPTLKATLPRHYVSRAPIHAPVTVAFGGRDVLLLPWQSRHLDELPSDVVVRTLPGCGHIPIADDPAAVVALIEASTRPSHRTSEPAVPVRAAAG